MLQMKFYKERSVDILPFKKQKSLEIRRAIKLKVRRFIDTRIKVILTIIIVYSNKIISDICVTSLRIWFRFIS